MVGIGCIIFWYDCWYWGWLVCCLKFGCVFGFVSECGVM